MSTNLTNETLLAFVDETGDRGYSKKSSEYFAMAAIVFPASVHQKVKDCITEIKTKFGVPINVPLHWRRHCQLHEFKKYAVSKISQLEDISIIYVISDKKTVLADHTKFYNKVAASTLERILKHAGEMKTKVCVRFGDIKGFDHSVTLDYFQKRTWRLGDYNMLEDQPKWIYAKNNSGIQIADCYAGILNSAINADRFGAYEASFLVGIKHQIRTSENGIICGYGIKAFSADNDPRKFKWWIKGWE